MKCRRMIKDDKGQNYVVWFGAKQPKGTTNNNVRALEFEETVEVDNWKFDVYTQNLSNEVNLNLTEGSGALSKEVDFWIPLEQTILSQSDVTFECQILNDIPKTANFTNVDISALPLTIDNLKPLEGSIIQLDTIKGRTVKWTQLVKTSLFKDTQTVSGVTFTFNKTSGTITVNGTATEDIAFGIMAPHGALNSSWTPADYAYMRGCPTGGSLTTYYLLWGNTSMKDTGNGIYDKASRYVTRIKDTTVIYTGLQIIIKSGVTMTNQVFRPQLFNVSDIYGLGKEPKTITDFNKDYPYSIYPYGKQEILTTKVSGIKIRAGYKNLLDKTKFAATQTINGVTFTNNGDGSYTLNGTATNYAYFHVQTFDIPVSSNNIVVKYLMRGYEFEPGDITNAVVLYLDTFYIVSDGTFAVRSKEGNIVERNNIYNPTNVRCGIRVSPNYTCNNLVIRPQLINLTNTYGAGNEPTTPAQFNQDFPDIDNIPYPEQTISFVEQTLYGINDAQDTLQVVKENNDYKLQKVENIGNVDLGTLTYNKKPVNDTTLPDEYWWSASYPNKFAIFDSYNIAPNLLTPNYYSERSKLITDGENHKLAYNKAISYGGGSNYVFIRDTSYTEASDLKTSLSGQILYYAKRTPTTTTIATLTKNQVTALFAKGYCVEILGNDDNNIIVRPDLSRIFNEFEADVGTGNVYFGLGNKKLDWVDEANLEAELSSDEFSSNQSNTKYDITHLRLQFLEDEFHNGAFSHVIRFKISSKNKMNWYNENDKHDNYAKEQEGVATSLTQRLSVLKNELWYNINEGLPLIDKYRNKNILDSYVASTILKHPDVINISEFTSSLNKNSYSCKVVVNTIYGNVDLTI